MLTRENKIREKKTSYLFAVATELNVTTYLGQLVYSNQSLHLDVIQKLPVNLLAEALQLPLYRKKYLIKKSLQALKYCLTSNEK